MTGGDIIAQRDVVILMKLVEQKFPIISIITVSFNAAEFIEQTIQSVLSQTYPHIEYIIIDGASTDGTVEIIRNYESRLAYWRSKPDRGLAHAFNLGFAQSHGDWILYLNADDFFLDHAVVEKMVPHLMLNQGADVVYGRVMSVSREQTPAPLLLKPIYYGNPWRWEDSRWEAVIPHPAAFTNRSYFKKVGEFDKSCQITVDYEFYLRAGRQLKAYFVPVNMSAMRVGGLSGNNQVVRIRREYRQVQQKYRVLPFGLLWFNFYWPIIQHFKRYVLHKIFDRYASKFAFKDRMSGKLINDFKHGVKFPTP
jgi:glycosyltransferase involved in cell wall biosynthesis